MSMDPNTAYWAGICIGAGMMLIVLGMVFILDEVQA